MTKVSYAVDPTRVGHSANLDRLTLEVWTNGAMKPQDAVALAARILVVFLEEFATLDKKLKKCRLLKMKKKKMMLFRK